jgi:sugar lactone lactonase YvrE
MSKSARSALLIFCGAGLAGACSGRDEGAPADTGADAAVRPAVVDTAPLTDSARVATISGFDTPESVRYDPDQDVYFVSNIRGNPSQKDNNGYISRITPDTDAPVVRFIESGRNGVTLNAPKGMAIIGDTLWVADIDMVRGFNRRTGQPVRSIDLTGHKATFLNDVAAGPGGTIWVTDSGIRFSPTGQMSETGSDRVFKIDGTAVSSVLQGKELGGPNGITWDDRNSRWLIAGFSGPNIIRFTDGDQERAVIARGPGGYDGLEVLPDGRILVTSWADSSVSVVTGDSLRRFITGVSAPADIGIDTKRMRLLLPRFESNTVEVWDLRR